MLSTLASQPGKGVAESPGGQVKMADWTIRLVAAVQYHLPQG